MYYSSDIVRIDNEMSLNIMTNVYDMTSRVCLFMNISAYQRSLLHQQSQGATS